MRCIAEFAYLFDQERHRCAPAAGPAPAAGSAFVNGQVAVPAGGQ